MKPFIDSTLKNVTDSEMESIYRQIKTPFKYGAVMKMENNFTDSPSVFFYDGKWYMYFISIAKDCSISGYETHLAVSDDLLNWKKIDTIFWVRNLCLLFECFVIAAHCLSPVVYQLFIVSEMLGCDSCELHLQYGLLCTEFELVGAQCLRLQ